jgi:hypothetical protein
MNDIANLTALHVVTADDDLRPEDGFYGPEGPPGYRFRWTGPGTSFGFRFEVDRSAPVMVRLECLGQQCRHNLHNVFCSFDGVLKPTFHQERGGCHLVSCRLHPRLRQGRTHIQFHLQHTQMPGGGDTRLLGVIFSRLLVLRLPGQDDSLTQG